MNVEKIDDELYKAIYGLPKVGNYSEIWLRIKSNPEILREAVDLKRDKFDEKDIVKGLTISNSILIDYDSVDPVAYNNLINSIYTNKDIARIVMDGASNGGFSFLLMSLFNHNLKLTEEQKAFAVNEAMNKVGTTRWKQINERFVRKLDDIGINDDNKVFMDIGGCVNPIGEKTGVQYMNYMFTSLGKEQAHGIGEFDIRYHILRNPNWTMEEKQKLIMDFWHDDETYSEYLEQWEWGIVNDFENFKEESVLLEKDYLYDYSYKTLLEFYSDKKTTDRIWEEIEFCKQMRQLRSPKYEEDYQIQKIIK